MLRFFKHKNKHKSKEDKPPEVPDRKSSLAHLITFIEENAENTQKMQKKVSFSTNDIEIINN